MKLRCPTGKSRASVLASACGLLACASVAHGQADMIVSDISGIDRYGSSNGIAAYAIGTTSCNVGTVLMSWQDDPGDPEPWRHPVIAQNLFRIDANGRFEQIGMSWCKHGFCAADASTALCNGGQCSNAGGCDWLGLGCSDTYWAGLNGNQFDLGPRSEINVNDGSFVWPNYGSPVGNNTIRGRVQVPNDDINPAMNAGAIYIGESQYVHPDDAGILTPQSMNNNTWRQVSVGSYNSSSGGAWNLNFTGSNMQQEPAILAWQHFDPSVRIENADIPGDGRFIIGVKVTDNGDGTWHYEYAVQNLTSQRGLGALKVAVANGATKTNMGFRDIHHHSGEPYSTTDWNMMTDTASVEWAVVSSFGANPNANALRWGTVYNFWFDSAAAPADGDVTFTPFAPGGEERVTITTTVPGDFTPECPGDITTTGGGAPGVPDGTTDLADLLYYVNIWDADLGNSPGSQADLTTTGTSAGDPNFGVPDDMVDLADLLYYVNEWGDGLTACP